ncbi:hypothetical protein KYK29_10315 [Shinella daejeonensis]|uniref:hypothetical protein n=1 Tax=Shinella daejeonensis TaxID=659017 RepID=UPI0020C7DFF6|nr:hypothetical protein [Shinella daejeonensis]MCP8895327.1 hypothetical protein [Shinella daejeonensis]
MTNLPAQLSTLDQEISALTEQLSPAGPDDIAKAIAWLMDGGMLFPASIKAADPVEEYRIVLKGVPTFGLRAAFSKIKRGEYTDLNPDFIPLPAALARLARQEALPKMELRRMAADRRRGIEESAKVMAERQIVSQVKKRRAADIIASVTAARRA